jgi:hypothetical protein
MVNKENPIKSPRHCNNRGCRLNADVRLEKRKNRQA